MPFYTNYNISLILEKLKDYKSGINFAIIMQQSYLSPSLIQFKSKNSIIKLYLSMFNFQLFKFLASLIVFVGIYKLSNSA
jgi:hypothetical protein